MRVVVTGGAGFLGSHLCRRLRMEGADVVVIDSLITGSPENMPTDDAILLDIAGRSPVDVRGPVDLIFHLASPASPRDYLRYPIQTLWAGSVGTLNVLELARAKEARFILASTSEVYGDPDVHPQPETYRGNVSTLGPRAVYDEAKRFSEAATMAYWRRLQVDVGIARIFNTYGPGMRRGDGRAVPAFIEAALAGERLHVHGDGAQTRTLCYVDDLIEGLWLLATEGVVGPVNLGGTDEVMVIDLARRIINLTESESKIRHVMAMTDDPEVRRPDIHLARAVLGWEPTIGLSEGLERTIEWYRSQRE